MDYIVKYYDTNSKSETPHFYVVEYSDGTTIGKTEFQILQDSGQLNISHFQLPTTAIQNNSPPPKLNTPKLDIDVNNNMIESNIPLDLLLSSLKNSLKYDNDLTDSNIKTIKKQIKDINKKLKRGGRNIKTKKTKHHSKRHSKKNIKNRNYK